MIPLPSFRFLAGLLLALPVVASAATYRWTDKEGKVHYTENPPPPNAVKVEEKRLRSNVIDTSGQPFAVQKASKDFPVTLYTGKDCGPACDKARALLSKRGVPYGERNLVSEEDGADYKKRFGDATLLVPALVVGARTFRGFEEVSWNGALDDAGYPRNAAPLPKAAPKTEPKADSKPEAPKKP